MPRNGQPPGNLRPPNSWRPANSQIQSLAAGPNDVIGVGFAIQLNTGSGLYDCTAAEHALGPLLNAARRFYEMHDQL